MVCPCIFQARICWLVTSLFWCIPVRCFEILFGGSRSRTFIICKWVGRALCWHFVFIDSSVLVRVCCWLWLQPEKCSVFWTVNQSATMYLMTKVLVRVCCWLWLQPEKCSVFWTVNQSATMYLMTKVLVRVCCWLWLQPEKCSVFWTVNQSATMYLMTKVLRVRL